MKFDTFNLSNLANAGNIVYYFSTELLKTDEDETWEAFKSCIKAPYGDVIYTLISVQNFIKTFERMLDMLDIDKTEEITKELSNLSKLDYVVLDG